MVDRGGIICGPLNFFSFFFKSKVVLSQFRGKEKIKVIGGSPLLTMTLLRYV